MARKWFMISGTSWTVATHLRTGKRQIIDLREGLPRPGEGGPHEPPRINGVGGPVEPHEALREGSAILGGLCEPSRPQQTGG